MFVLTSPLPLEGGEQDPLTPFTFGLFKFYVLAFLIALPLCIVLCGLQQCKEECVLTIAITSKSEQDLPTPFLVLLFTCLCCCVVSIIVASPILV